MCQWQTKLGKKLFQTKHAKTISLNTYFFNPPLFEGQGIRNVMSSLQNRGIVQGAKGFYKIFIHEKEIVHIQCVSQQKVLRCKK